MITQSRADRTYSTWKRRREAEEIRAARMYLCHVDQAERVSHA